MTFPQMTFPPMKAQRLYSQEITRGMMGLFMGMVDVLEGAQTEEDQTDYGDMRVGLSEIEYDAGNDVFIFCGTRQEYVDLCGLLLEAHEIAKTETFLDAAALLSAVLDEADHVLFVTARWN